MKTYFIHNIYLYITICILLFQSCSEQNTPHNISGIFLINTDGSNQKELVSNSGGNIFVVNNNIIYGALYSMKNDGSDQYKLLSSGLSTIDYSISHDLTEIIFTVGTDIYVVKIDGSGLSKINIPDTTSNKLEPTLSFDNKEIIYGTKSGLFKISTNGSNYKQLKASPTNSYFQQPKYLSENSLVYAEYNNSTGRWTSLHIMYLLTLEDTTIYNFAYSSGNYYELSSQGNILFTMGGEIHELYINTLSDNILSSGQDAHYSPDYTKVSYIDSDNNTINIIDLGTKVIKKIKTSFNSYNNISTPKLSLDNSSIYFIGISLGF